MAAEIEKEIKDWLNDSSKSSMFREVSIKGHAHGVRVELSEFDCSNVAFAVADNVADAFHECLKNYDVCKYNNLKNRVVDTRNRIREEELELERRKTKLKQDKITMEECAKRADIKIEKILVDKSW